MKLRLLLALALFPGAANAVPVAYFPTATWVQLAPGGGAEIRSVAVGGCPEIVFDQPKEGPSVPRVQMLVRAGSSAEFPFVCSLPIPAGTKRIGVVQAEMGEPKATIMRDFPAPPADPQRILVLGDTGCRVKGTYLQACNDPLAWPFAGLAKAAAALKPDLVIHLGDYLYRESPCPENNAGCAGSPYGDNWQTWNADFFAPAEPLLAAAPWLIVRGNHEDCQRAGPGFLRLLGPETFDPAAPCIEHLPPYAAMAGEQTIAIMDNASASDTSVDEKSVALYRADFDMLKALANIGMGRELWLAAHRPIWAAITGPLGIPIGGNATLIASAGDLSAFAAITLMLSGHIHTFEAINYEAKVPPQIVAGHGGDNLDPTPANLRGAIFQGHSGVRVKDGLSVGGFGFLLLSREADQASWLITLYDSSGAAQRQCRFAAGRVSCPPAK